jgi:hypothetical protein
VKLKFNAASLLPRCVLVLLQLCLFDGRIYGLQSDRSDLSLHFPRRVAGLPGLYLTGQTTHLPGVNVAAVSGLLTADVVLEDW